MDEELARLAEFGRLELEAFWHDRFGEVAPKMRSAELMRRRTAGRLQEEVHGKLKKGTRRRLKELVNAYEKDKQHLPHATTELRPGMTLTREWQHAKHTVKVLQAGFEYRGERYNSLSSVARSITGTRWSGPVFFGLKKARIRAGAKP